MKYKAELSRVLKALDFIANINPQIVENKEKYMTEQLNQLVEYYIHKGVKVTRTIDEIGGTKERKE